MGIRVDDAHLGKWTPGVSCHGAALEQVQAAGCKKSM